MIDHLVNGRYRAVRIHHVRMAFSLDTAEIGQFRLRKLSHLVCVIARIGWSRMRHGCHTLCYPPAGQTRNALYRDIAILLLTRPFFRRTVFYFHAGGVSELVRELPPPVRWLARRAYRRPDCSIRPSRLNPDDGGSFGSARDVVIPNAVEDVYPVFTAGHRRREGRPRLLYMGILYESKGVLVLIEACAELARRGHDFEVHFAGAFGSQDFEKKARDFAARPELAGRVHFAGVLRGNDKWQAFLDADIFCFPSYFESETFGLVVLEAMQFALPVVATRWRGIPSLVRDNETGLLVDVRDSDALASAVARLLSSPEEAKRMGRGGREAFCAHYTLPDYLAAMESVLADPAPRPPKRIGVGPLDCTTHTRRQFVAELRGLLQDRKAQPRTLACINAHIHNLAVHDAGLRQRLNAMRVVAADGISIVWASRVLGHAIPERCNMTEAFRDFLETGDMPPSSAVLIGCTEEEVARAARTIGRLSGHCRIVAAWSGYRTMADYRVLLAEQEAVDLVLVGAGTPRSEELVERACEWQPEAVAWHIGGGTIRILAGTIREAPAWMRWAGLQWLHRLWLEPVRLGRRYLVGNPTFILRVLLHALRRKRT